ncbi:MAG TPA: molybdopterin-synthase adenylyltransferase MoeB [Candidatus Sulfotelmatobacter sp.]|nr:molybdopterin-synthase adenylyltransferase MoeB [Candidatus Sulfotelmatobacter sp.]
MERARSAPENRPPDASGTAGSGSGPSPGLGFDFSDEERERYSRHLVLDGIGPWGQRRLRQARVVVLGVGGLGSPVGMYLAGCGVGKLGLVDFDTVDRSNLQRQVVHGDSSTGRPKAEVAKERLEAINPGIEIVAHNILFSRQNAESLLEGYDVAVDCTDNFHTRYLANDAAYLGGKPLVHGSIFRFEGQATVFVPGGGCYRCLYPEPPPPGVVPSCRVAGVLGALPGVIGAIQAVEVIKLITGAGRPLVGRLLLHDALAMSFREVRVRRNPACALCGDAPTIRQLIDYEAFVGDPLSAAARL